MKAILALLIMLDRCAIKIRPKYTPEQYHENSRLAGESRFRVGSILENGEQYKKLTASLKKRLRIAYGADLWRMDTGELASFIAETQALLQESEQEFQKLSG